MSRPCQRRFEQFIEPHLDALRRTAYRLCRNAIDAEDLVQEVCLRAYERLDDVATFGSPRAWLFRVQYNLHIDTERRRASARLESLDDRIGTAVIVSASDPVFEAPALEAATQARYKPRVVEGVAQAVPGVRNLYRFQMQPDAPGPVAADRKVAAAAASDPNALDAATFTQLLRPAYACLEHGDLRCIELVLDEIIATYTLTPEQASRVAGIYGFIHHRHGQYERAIEAYRKAAAGAASGSYDRAAALMIVARIHYEQSRYQEALDAAIESLMATPRPPLLSDYVFVDRLRALGATVR